MSEKKQQTAAGLFFSMLLRAAVIIVGLAIVAFGAFFVIQVVKGDSLKKNTPATTLDENALTDAQVDNLQMNASTEAAAESQDGAAGEADASGDAKSKKIMVLNSTGIAGLAGRWCETLNADGYADTSASDYSESLADTKIIAKEDGVGRELVNYFAAASYEVGTVTSGTSEPTDGYDIVIILGASDSNH